MADPYRILSLDGGGMRGIFTASALTALERDLEVCIADHVDLIVGTSTGALIGLGIAAGKSPAEMLDFYEVNGPKIFRRPRRLSRPWRPKYDRTILDQLLLQEFGELTLNDLSTPVCITAHELVAGTTRVWKDDHHPDLSGGGRQLVWKVAAATAAAPTYFAPFQINEADSHVDGGIWANNPAMVGVAEAVHYGGRRLEDIHLLSVGTTSRVFRVADHQEAVSMGAWAWGVKARELLLGGGVSTASDHQVRFLLSEGSYLRIDHERSTNAPLDDVGACRGLRELGEQAARTNRSQVRAVLGL
jgi:patatin-like phospholipase/acyl hydrolase